MGSAHMTVGELSSFLMYAFWVGLSIGGIPHKQALRVHFEKQAPLNRHAFTVPSLLSKTEVSEWLSWLPVGKFGALCPLTA